jgi:hypothetical protein
MKWMYIEEEEDDNTAMKKKLKMSASDEVDVHSFE